MKFGIFYEHQLPRPWQRRRRAAPVPGRARPGRARRPARLRLRVGGRAPLPRGVLALVRARGLPRRVLAAHEAHPPRPRHRADAAGLQPPGEDRVAHRDARPRLERSRRLRHRRVRLAPRARGLRHRPGARSRRCGARPPSRSATCSRWTRTPATRASTSRCRAATWCRSRCRSRTRRSGSRARTATRSSRPRGSAIGALTFAFVDPNEARQWVHDYYETFKRECVPIGHAVNPNIAMVTGFSVHRRAGGGRAPRRRRLQVLRLRARTPLRVRRAAPGPHRHLGQLREVLEPVPRPRGPRHRHAGAPCAPTCSR